MPARRRLLRSSSPWGEAISSSSLAAGEPDATASLASSSISSRGCLTGVVGQVTGGSDRREPYRSHEFCRSMGRARDEPGDLGCISGFRYGAIVGRCQLLCRVMRASLAATASCSRAFCAAIAAAQRRCHCSTKRVASAYAASAKPTSTMAYTASTLSGMFGLGSGGPGTGGVGGRAGGSSVTSALLSEEQREMCANAAYASAAGLTKSSAPRLTERAHQRSAQRRTVGVVDGHQVPGGSGSATAKKRVPSAPWTRPSTAWRVSGTRGAVRSKRHSSVPAAPHRVKPSPKPPLVRQRPSLTLEMRMTTDGAITCGRKARAASPCTTRSTPTPAAASNSAFGAVMREVTMTFGIAGMMAGVNMRFPMITGETSPASRVAATQLAGPFFMASFATGTITGGTLGASLITRSPIWMRWPTESSAARLLTLWRATVSQANSVSTAPIELKGL
mmetsp:Transcript_1287/g.2878  ORF Transcript_1287/g.2878 Transcript_1287/m.2878 type:complete len:448 (+) Transcript_1287:468-1811(+)